MRTLQQQLDSLSDEKLQLLWYILCDEEIHKCLCSQEQIILAGLQLRVSMELTYREERSSREMDTESVDCIHDN